MSTDAIVIHIPILFLWVIGVPFGAFVILLTIVVCRVMEAMKDGRYR